MASFQEILKRPMSEFKPPQAYPVGTYHCLVDGAPEPGKSKNDNTFLKFKFKILAPMDDVNAAEAAEQQIVGKFIVNDYYLTDGATYRLTEMLAETLGIKMVDASGKEKPLEEGISEAQGKQLLVTLKHELSQDGKRSFHRVDRTAHV